MKRVLFVLMCLFLSVPAWAEEARNVPILTVKAMPWDERALEEAFLEGRDVEMERDESGALSYRNGDGAGEKIYASEAVFGFRSRHIGVDDAFVLRGLDEGEARGGEVEGFSLDDAVQMLKEKLSLIGVETGELFRHSALKRDDFAALRREYARQRREEYAEYESVEAGLLREKETLNNFQGLTPPDDGYLLRLAKAHKGITCQLPRSWKNAFESQSTYIVAYVTPTGVQYLEMDDDVFSVARERTPDGKIPISREKAELIFKSARQDGETPLAIARVAYEYVPVPKRGAVYLRPAWCFYAQAGAEDPGSDGYIAGAVDAYTGKML